MIEPINKQWDFPDTEIVADGYHDTCIPKATTQNFIVLMDKINELIREMNSLLEDEER